METRFLSHESWRQALFGSHPRHVIIADSTAVQITDMRVDFTFTCVHIYEPLFSMKWEWNNVMIW